MNEEEIIEKSGLEIGNSIWNMASEKKESALEEMAEVATAEVSRSLPNTAVITVSEHPRVAYLFNDGKYYPILSTAYSSMKYRERTFLPMRRC